MQSFERNKMDPMDPYVPFHAGYYELWIKVAGRQRRMITYIPRETQSSVAGIFLLPPSGVSAKAFLEQSSWVDLADSEETKEKFVLFVLEPEPSGWDAGEPYGRPDGDVAYIHAAFATASLRTIICVHEAKYYMVGYREGGALAQMAAMYDPALYAGVTSVDAPAVSPAYIEAAGKDYALNLMGFEDPDHTHGLRKSDIPLPVWLIGSEDPDETPEARYWRKACGCGETARLFDRQTRVYVRTEDTHYPQNQDKAAYRVWCSRIPDASEALGRKLNRRVWKDFLYGVRRWMADPGGSLRVTKDPVRDLGMEYRYEPVDGWMREWYVYVPETVRSTPEKEVPLVFAMHGYSCSGEIYMGNSGWNDVADRYGFIVIFPSAVFGHIEGAGHSQGGAMPDNAPLPTWNALGRREGRPYELNFFRHMLEDACARYSIDRSRIYATGHSNGSQITSWLGVAKPEWFAAIAPCSGIIHMAAGAAMLEQPEARDRRRMDLPVWMFGGGEEPWLLDGVPAAGNRTCASIHAWWEMNEMPGEKPADFDEFKVHAERWHDWVYKKNGIPMVAFTEVTYFPHATMPEMSFRIWEEFFSKISRDKNGTICYQAD